ncbi:GNAT family N-acetyltransferase [Actinophytocola glycyrrhizae]|uniref:GNAT family N-acetyltransferase n=1 Tax=Actinophytocola glycyrrhizae TaxID=2044873 RepID=A0ABV9RZ72_9PSEU
MTVSVHDPRHDPPPSGWSDFVTRQHLYPPWEYGLLGMEAWLSRNPPLLAVARSGDEIIGAMAVLVCVPGRGDRYAPSRTHRLVPKIAQVYQPWLGGEGFFVPSGDQDVVRALERGVRAHVGPLLAGLVYRNVPVSLAPLVSGRGRLVRRVTPAASVLENTFADEDEWLASLSRNRRKNIRRVDRLVAADPSLVVRFGPGRTDVDGVALAGMLRTHRAKFGRQPFDPRTPVAGAYLAEVVRRPDVHTLTYSDVDGQVLAFSTYLDHPVTPILQFWASREDRGHLYFDCHARAIRHVIAGGRKELSAGRGKSTEKGSLGFGARPMCVVGVPGPLVGR